MGEPLLYSKFEDFIKIVKNYKLKLNLTTNGTFPRLGVEKWGNLILPISSDVKISINGFSKDTSERIMSGLNYEKQLENIKKFCSKNSIDYYFSDTSIPLEDFLLDYLTKGSLFH